MNFRTKKKRVVHRAAFKPNIAANYVELTVCGKTGENSNKTSDDSKVTCLLCLEMMKGK